MSNVKITVPYTCIYDTRNPEKEWPNTREQCQKAMVEFQARALEGKLPEFPGFVAESCSVTVDTAAAGTGAGNRGDGTEYFKTTFNALCKGTLYWVENYFKDYDEGYKVPYCESHSDPVECALYE